jgi:ribose-phosphate pyrophosphokinase
MLVGRLGGVARAAARGWARGGAGAGLAGRVGAEWREGGAGGGASRAWMWGAGAAAAGLAWATGAEGGVSAEGEARKEEFRTMRVFSGNANRELASEIVQYLGIGLGKISVGRFSDGEVSVAVNENVRGKDVYIIQPTSTPVNDHLVELLLMVSCMRRSSADKITAVIPYYGYARQDRKLTARVPISAADIARLLEAVGVDRVIAVDLHCGQIQGFFGPRVPVDNLDGGVIGVTYFANKGLVNPVIVSPDAGGVYRAKAFREGLNQLSHGKLDAGLAMIIKQRVKANEVDRMDLVGTVQGADVIIVDDMIDTAGTLSQAAAHLKENGARRVFAFATHGVFSGPAIDRIERSILEEVVVLNTIPLPPQAKSAHKVKQLSIAPLLAESMRRVHTQESISAIFSRKE